MLRTLYRICRLCSVPPHEVLSWSAWQQGLAELVANQAATDVEPLAEAAAAHPTLTITPWGI